MPLVLHAYLALVAGLIAGFLAPLRESLCIAVVAAALAGARRDTRVAALVLTGATGVLLGADADRRARACRWRIERSTTWPLVLQEPARPGARARAVARDGACALPATLRVARGRADAGRHVLASGVLTPTDRGVRLDDVVLVPRDGRDVLLAWRARVAALIDERFGPRAPLVRALVVADAAAIDPAVRARYADAGLVHALSVSGLHVALVGGALALLLRALRLSARAAAAASVVAVAGYVLLIGAPAPAVRAGAMLAVGALERILQRPTSPWAVLALGSATPLVDPAAVLDLGYQLSVAGMAALVAGRVVARRVDRWWGALPTLALPGHGRGDGALGRDRLWHQLGERLAPLGPALRGVRRELVVGTLATLVTAPLVAWHFGQVSLVGPLANVAAGPILALLQPTLFLAVLPGPLAPLGQLAADAARPLLDALDRVATVAANAPGGVARLSPTLVEAVLAGGAVGALIAATAARRPMRAALAGVACLVLLAWAPYLPRAGVREAELHLLDVGQGDAVAVRAPSGRWVLVDAGRSWRGGDAGARTVVPHLRRHGGQLAALVLTHPHADHVGGAATVLRRLRPPLVWDAAFTLGSGTYAGVLDAARATGARWRRVRPGDSLAVDGVVLRVLAPDSAWTASLDDPNLASVVLAVEFGRVRFLLVGDAEAPEERWLLDRAAADPQVGARLRADVLKVGHHGSRTSTSPEFLAAVRPRVALVSVGAGNDYGHPSPSVMRRLRDAGATVLRTDQLGTVVVRTDGRRLTISGGGETWAMPAPPPPTTAGAQP